MKKLMIVAAAAAMTMVSNAALKPTDCKDCSVTPGVLPECDTIVFKVTGSGKAVADKGDYKTVESLKIKKGALALEGTYCAANDACCYDNGYFYATIKVGKKTFEMAAPVDLTVWSLFGKNLEKSRNYLTSIKPGSKVSLDSAMFVTCADTEFDGDIDLSDFAFWASAFGKVDMKVTSAKKGKSGYCEKDPGTTGCDPIYTPKTYNGWFVGTYPCVNEADCFLCDCPEIDIFGGTWKAAYQSKYTTQAEAAKLAGVTFIYDDED